MSVGVDRFALFWVTWQRCATRPFPVVHFSGPFSLFVFEPMGLTFGIGFLGLDLEFGFGILCLNFLDLDLEFEFGI